MTEDVLYVSRSKFYYLNVVLGYSFCFGRQMYVLLFKNYYKFIFRNILLGYIINDRMRIFYCLMKDFILKSLIYMYIVYVSILWKRN